MNAIRLEVTSRDFKEIEKVSKIFDALSISYKIKNLGDNTLEGRLTSLMLSVTCSYFKTPLVEVLERGNRSGNVKSKYVYCYLAYSLFPTMKQEIIAKILERHRSIITVANNYIGERIFSKKPIASTPDSKQLAIDIANVKSLIEGNKEFKKLKEEYDQKRRDTEGIGGENKSS